ncbi:zinc ribbon domain-containing protein, partial [Streptomyces montanisoli]
PRALLVPVDEPQARPEREQPVAPVLPGRPEPVRPGVRAPGEQQIQGGIPCPWCGTTNRPDRHFCTRCAMRMSESPDGGARAPWWRRLFDRDNREQPWAGERPRLRWQFGRIVKYVVWAAVLGLAVWGVTNIGTGVSAVRDHFANRASIAPDTFKASHSYSHHSPKLAFDKYSNTWWGPGYAESGQGEWIEAHFQQPVNLLDVGITSGESAHADSLSKSARPHRMQALVTTDDGKTHTMDLILDQTSGFQSRAFRYHNVTSVRFTLGTAYGTGPKKQVAIAEIEFFGPSQGGSA